MRNWFTMIALGFLLTSSPLFAAESVDCEGLNHARAYWVDEDGTPHWRMYTFQPGCKEVTIQRWHGNQTVGQPIVDQIDGVFRCSRSSGGVCQSGFSWTLEPNGKLTAKTEDISTTTGGKRLEKKVIARHISLETGGTLQELLIADTFFKDQDQQEWFNVKTTRSRCGLTTTPNCQWNTDVRR